MNKSIFVTGTNTDVGKTFVSCLILQAFKAIHHATFAIKPIASGSFINKQGLLRNHDALQLAQSATIKQPYDMINPFIFEKPIAPHIAARENQVNLSIKCVSQAICQSLQHQADINLIEGAGGWLVPLNSREMIADLVIQLQIPVILVVGIKLGCLNHALLTQHSILSSRIPFIGWVANCLEPNTLAIEENIKTLHQWLKAPCLGIVSYGCRSPDQIDITPIQAHLFQQSRIA